MLELSASFRRRINQAGGQARHVLEQILHGDDAAIGAAPFAEVRGDQVLEDYTARSGQLQRIVFNDKWEEKRREPLLRELHQRIRDVRQGPDGLLYLLTEEDAAAVLRIEPN